MWTGGWAVNFHIPESILSVPAAEDPKIFIQMQKQKGHCKPVFPGVTK